MIPGIDNNRPEFAGDLIDVRDGADGLFRVGVDGVRCIATTRDRKQDFIAFADKTLCYIKSAMGHPALYPLSTARFEGPAEAVLMDLDGTSVHSEAFWMWVIEQTTSRLLGDPSFHLQREDEPHVSGHSVSEHLQYCIDTYCPGRTVEDARRHYFDITRHEMAEITAGRGRVGAFTPAPGLKEFLFELKAAGVKVGLVTSGLFEKAWPEIVDAFRVLGMGDPRDFYDAIISAGHALTKGQAGTLGELAPKPHPWLYAETVRVGLGIPPERYHRCIGIEDSGAGVISIRLAGMAAIGVAGGNLAKAGVRPLLHAEFDDLRNSLPAILGR